MFKNSYQSGFLSIFYSVGSNPLAIWDKSVKNGHIRRVSDEDVKSLVLELSGTNVATTYITCPIKPRASLGIKLPYLVMIVKNMKKYFTFEIQIRDDKDMHRRFRVSNFQSTTKVRPFCTSMPIGLSSGWNQIQFNLADFTRRAYGTTYLETTRVQIHANVRIRRIYFADRLYSEDEMPQEFKLFLPAEKTQARDRKLSTKKSQEAIARQSKTIETKPQPQEGAAEASPVEPIPVEGPEIPSGAPPTPIATDISEEPVADAEVPETAEAAPEESPDYAAEGAGDAAEAQGGPSAEPVTDAVGGDEVAAEEISPAVEEALPAEEAPVEAPPAEEVTGELTAELPEELPAEAPAEVPAEIPAEVPAEGASEMPAEETAEAEAPPPD